MSESVLDLFAGPGGWDCAAQQLGLDPLGIEWDDAACATRKAAGLRTQQADVASLDPADFTADGLIASPPCQAWSMAGKRGGEKDKRWVYQCADELAKGMDRRALIRDVICKDDRSILVCEPVRWVRALRPAWVALEQVPPVLELWTHFAWLFRQWGYKVWTGIVNAADYGVPQTRRRAVLLARLDGPVMPPEPTHCRGGSGPSMFGDGLAPWVTMATALGWGMTERPGFTFAPGTSGGGPALDGGGSGARRSYVRERDEGRWVVRTGNNSTIVGNPYERSTDEPAPTLDTKVGTKWTLHTNRDQQPDGTRQTVSCDEPAPSFTAKSGGQWVYERPATTVQGDPRIGRPGHKDRDEGESQFEQGSIRVSIRDAAVLQSFAPDYPWRGTRTKQFEQIGNAIPPRLALALLTAVTGLEREAAA